MPVKHRAPRLLEARAGLIVAEPKYLSGNHLAGCGDDREPSTRSLQASESISHLITGGCIRDHTPAQRRAGASRAKTTAAHAAQLAQQAPALWFNSLHSPTPPRASTSKHEPPAGTRPHQDREQRPARQRASKTASQPASQPARRPKGGANREALAKNDTTGLLGPGRLPAGQAPAHAFALPPHWAGGADAATPCRTLLRDGPPAGI
jgi:hypothetical protein